MNQEENLQGWTEDSERRSERADCLRGGDPLIREEEESGWKDQGQEGTTPNEYDLSWKNGNPKNL